jgi:hypothetical protein
MKALPVLHLDRERRMAFCLICLVILSAYRVFLRQGILSASSAPNAGVFIARFIERAKCFKVVDDSSEKSR